MLDEDFNGSQFKSKQSAAQKREISDREKFESFLFKIWQKAQQLEFDDFKGWANGEGYIVSRFEEPPFKKR